MDKHGVDALRQSLESLTRDGELCASLDNGWVRCFACGHRCKIGPGKEGICHVRRNAQGVLQVPAGYVAALAVDPIEKKPFFHVLPGRTALSFGMLGCDYRCAYCQNWETSQVLRDPEAWGTIQEIPAERIVELAIEHGAPMVTSTYNEPLITSEWAREVFRHAKAQGLACSFVSNGNGTPEAIRYLAPVLDCYKVDLKSFRQKNYQQLGGRLDTVLDTIRLLVREHIWLEVVTLVVPGFNDSREELADIAGFLASVSPDIPWHVTAFHPDYAMTGPLATPAAALMRAAETGEDAGLHYVYAGNLPGKTGRYEHTVCPSCRTTVIERRGFTIIRNVMEHGACPRCHTPIPGVWALPAHTPSGSRP